MNGEPQVQPDHQAILIPIDRIIPNPANARKTFDDESLEQMAASMRVVGILEPVVVTRVPDSVLFMLLAGERRLRAARIAGLETIRASLRDDIEGDTEQEIAGLIENLHREELTHTERANGMDRLRQIGKLTQRQVADRLGVSQTTVSRSLTLLKLPEKAQLWVDHGELPLADAAKLWQLPPEKRETVLAEETFRPNLLERLERDASDGGTFVERARRRQHPAVALRKAVERFLANHADELEHPELADFQATLDALGRLAGRVEVPIDPMPSEPNRLPHTRCPVCGGSFAVRRNGVMREHMGEVTDSGRVPKCAGSGKPPLSEPAQGEESGTGDVDPADLSGQEHELAMLAMLAEAAEAPASLIRVEPRKKGKWACICIEHGELPNLSTTEEYAILKGSDHLRDVEHGVLLAQITITKTSRRTKPYEVTCNLHEHGPIGECEDDVDAQGRAQTHLDNMHNGQGVILQADESVSAAS